MAHIYYQTKSVDSQQKNMPKPKRSSIDFIRQFARTCVAVQGCALGTFILN